MPSRQRTNSMAIGQSAAITIASCPAPLGSRIVGISSAPAAACSRSCSAGVQGAARAEKPAWIASPTPCSRATAPNAASIAATARSRPASSGARTSRLNSTWPGMTLTAPGLASIRPTVAVTPGRARAIRRTATTISDAAASASRRPVIGTVPACPAVPVTTTPKRRMPLIALTTPSASPACSSTGPCSICGSM